MAVMAVMAAVRMVPAGVVTPVAVAVIAVVSVAVVSMPLRMTITIAVSIDRPTWRSHHYRRYPMARCHHDVRGVSKYHPRKWRKRKANVYVDSCLGSRSRSEKNRCEHC